MTIGDVVYIGNTVLMINFMLEADVMMRVFRSSDPQYIEGNYLMVPQSRLLMQDEEGVYSIEDISGAVWHCGDPRCHDCNCAGG